MSLANVPHGSGRVSTPYQFRHLLVHRRQLSGIQIIKSLNDINQLFAVLWNYQLPFLSLSSRIIRYNNTTIYQNWRTLVTRKKYWKVVPTPNTSI